MGYGPVAALRKHLNYTINLQGYNTIVALCYRALPFVSWQQQNRD